MSKQKQLTKAEMLKEISRDTGINKVEVLETLMSMAITISNHLQLNKTVVISELGRFKKITRAARQARNPRTGETIQVPAKTTVVFKPAKELLKKLN